MRCDFFYYDCHRQYTTCHKTIGLAERDYKIVQDPRHELVLLVAVAAARIGGPMQATATCPKA